MFRSSFFDPEDNISELINGDRFIISGRKGDGKSAYSAQISLLEDELDLCAVKKPLNNFNNIVFEKLSTYRNLGGNPYISFWKCVLMIESVKLINDKEPFVSNRQFNELVSALQETGLLENEDISRTITKLVETNTSFSLKSVITMGNRNQKTKESTGNRGNIFKQLEIVLSRCIFKRANIFY